MYCVYILASIRRTLYIGVTGKLEERIIEHKAHREPTVDYLAEALVRSIARGRPFAGHLHGPR